MRREYNHGNINAIETENVDWWRRFQGGRLVNPTAYEAAKLAGGVSLAPGPLFIVAMWRGGSSLLYALLNKHPQVALTFEADLWRMRSVFYKPARYCDWAARW